MKAGPSAEGNRVTCSAELANLPRLLALVARAGQCLQLDAQALHDLRLIAEEACVNVMRHAYPEGRPGPMTLEVKALPQGSARRIVLTLQDQGRPFDPLSTGPVHTAAPAATRVPGGLGVHLIRELSDHLHYVRDPRRGNVFTIEKILATAGPS